MRIAISALLVVSGTACAQYIQDDVVEIWVVEGETTGDEFGFTCDAVGDINGDGVSDVIVGAQRANANRGKTYVFSGADGALIRSHEGETPNGGIGFRQKPAGDLDADGVPDYLLSEAGFGCCYSDQSIGIPANTLRGRLLVHSGASGDLIVALEGETDGDRFGFDAIGIGDVNGDGANDIVVGAPGFDTDDENAGRVYVFSGADWSIIRTHDGVKTLARHGMGIGALHDVNGDGVDEYLIGAPGGGATNAGTVDVVSGATGEILGVLDASALPHAATAREFGRFFVYGAGDLDGDGVDDIYVSDMFDNTNGPITGRAYVFSGAHLGLMFTLVGDTPQGWFSVGRGMSDTDADGRADLVISTLGANDAGNSTGRVELFDGRTGCAIRRISSTRTSLPDGQGFGEAFGYDVTSAGDVDGDGIPDILATAAWGPGASLPGHAYMIQGQRHDAPCPADIDCDGELTISDFVAFQLTWSQGLLRADCNTDGIFNVLDFVCFQQVFVAGCP